MRGAGHLRMSVMEASAATRSTPRLHSRFSSALGLTAFYANLHRIKCETIRRAHAMHLTGIHRLAGVTVRSHHLTGRQGNNALSIHRLRGGGLTDQAHLGRLALHHVHALLRLTGCGIPALQGHAHHRLAVHTRRGHRARDLRVRAGETQRLNSLRRIALTESAAAVRFSESQRTREHAGLRRNQRQARLLNATALREAGTRNVVAALHLRGALIPLNTRRTVLVLAAVEQTHRLLSLRTIRTVIHVNTGGTTQQAGHAAAGARINSVRGAACRSVCRLIFSVRARLIGRGCYSIKSCRRIQAGRNLHSIRLPGAVRRFKQGLRINGR
ncbi:predicted membrane metal-binding protein [Rothia mucilaginosa DY-18]|uniref:Predicted membrane metal-binding protein n=1 Tax=Rothia mucilaginosa (strain DY-18) TaxID=680646 RepID=D2NPS6_ROTMD|nr:predicted membrane metal-binding protein [Rothia mucilaginosa DY-18]